MMTWSALARHSLVSSALVLAFFVGCQIQREGERCSLLNGNNDCQEPLVCTAASSLRADDGVNRCCPDSGTVTDDRCGRRVTGSGGMGGDTGAGGSASGSGSASSTGGTGLGGAQGLGDACKYRSDCQEGLDCGPTGECQYECMDNVDCDDGFTCNDQRRCVAP